MTTAGLPRHRALNLMTSIATCLATVEAIAVADDSDPRPQNNHRPVLSVYWLFICIVHCGKDNNKLSFISVYMYLSLLFIPWRYGL